MSFLRCLHTHRRNIDRALSRLHAPAPGETYDEIAEWKANRRPLDEILREAHDKRRRLRAIGRGLACVRIARLH